MNFEKYQLDDFLAISSLEPDALSEVYKNIETSIIGPVSYEKLKETIEEVLGDKKSIASALVRELIIIRGSFRKKDFEIEDIRNSILNAINVDPDWSEEQINSWKKIEQIFLEILELPIVRIITRAINLSYEYSNIWKGARILTDIRPIFDELGKSIEGSVISHCFRLRFDSVNGRNELNVALDISDIESLLEQCNRAITKAKTAKQFMETNAKVPTMISGDRNNG